MRSQILFSMCLTVSAAGLAGQSHVPPAGVGDTIRVTLLNGTQAKGALIDLRGDTLQLTSDQFGGLSLGFDDIARLEVYRGRRPAAGRGAVIGLVVGPLVGVLAGAAAGSQKGDCTMGLGYAPCAPLYAAGFGFLGLVAGPVFGAIAGRAIGRERWETVAPAGVHVTLRAPRSGLVALNVALSF